MKMPKKRKRFSGTIEGPEVSYLDFNAAIFSEVFQPHDRLPDPLRPVRHIGAHPEALRNTLTVLPGAPEDPDEALRVLVSRVRFLCSSRKALQALLKDLTDTQIGLLAPQGEGHRAWPFFYVLYFLCLVAAGWGSEEDEGSFAARIARLLDCNEPTFENGALDELWESLATWLETDRSNGPLRRLVLPPRGGEGHGAPYIGRTLFLAFPGRRDRSAVRRALRSDPRIHALGDEGPPLRLTLSALRRHIHEYTESFREHLLEVCDAVDRGTNSVDTWPLWSGVQAFLETLDAEDLQPHERLRVKLGGVLDASGGLTPFVACQNEAAASDGLECQPLGAVELGDFGLCLLAPGEEPAPERARSIALEVLQGQRNFQSVGPAVRQGVLPLYQPESSNFLLSQFGSAAHGLSSAFVQDRRLDAFLAAFGGHVVEHGGLDEVKGWSLVESCEIRVGDEPSPGLEDVSVLLRSGRRKALQITGRLRVPGGFLFMPGEDPVLRGPDITDAVAFREDEYDLKRTDEGWRVRVPEAGEWRLLVRQNVETRPGEPSIEQNVERRVMFFEQADETIPFRSVDPTSVRQENRQSRRPSKDARLPDGISVSESTVVDVHAWCPETALFSASAQVTNRPGEARWRCFRDLEEAPITVHHPESPAGGAAALEEPRPLVPSRLRVLTKGVLRTPAPPAIEPPHSLTVPAPGEADTDFEGVATDPRTQRLEELLTVAGQRRSGLPYNDVLGWMSMLFEVEKSSAFALIRAWFEQGAFEIVETRGWGSKLIVPRAPYWLTCTAGDRIRAVLMGLVGERRRDRLRALAERRGDRLIELRGPTGLVPPILRLEVGREIELEDLGEALGVRTIHWLDWPKADQLPGWLNSSLLQLRSDTLPRGHASARRGGWRMACEAGRWSHRRPADEARGLLLEKRVRRGDGPIYVVSEDGRPLGWTRHSVTAFLAMCQHSGARPFVTSESEPIVAIGARQLRLPIEVGRLCPLLGVGSSGPVNGGSERYAYPLGRALRRALCDVLPVDWRED